MKKSIGGLLAAVLLISSTNSLKLDIERKIGAPLRPARKYGNEESELMYTLASDFQEFLSGLTRQ